MRCGEAGGGFLLPQGVLLLLGNGALLELPWLWDWIGSDRSGALQGAGLQAPGRGSGSGGPRRDDGQRGHDGLGGSGKGRYGAECGREALRTLAPLCGSPRPWPLRSGERWKGQENRGGNEAPEQGTAGSVQWLTDAVPLAASALLRSGQFHSGFQGFQLAAKEA